MARENNEELLQNALNHTLEYVSSHSEIKCSESCLGIPQAYREEFYGLIDEARIALANCALADCQEELKFADRCVVKLDDVLERMEKATGARVILPAELDAFRKDRILGSSEPIMGSLLSFVQGTLSSDDLLGQAEREIAPLFGLLTTCAYETWMAYEAVLALKPKAVYLADTFDQSKVIATPTNMLPLGRQMYSAVMRLPEAVFDCGDSFWAIKNELSSELDFYASKPLRRRDFSAGGDTRGTLGRRLLMLYRIPGLDSIPILANRDLKIVYPPDAIIGAIRSSDVEGNLYGNACMSRISAMKPKKGALLVDIDGCAAKAQQIAEEYQTPVTFVENAFDTNNIAQFITTLVEG